MADELPIHVANVVYTCRMGVDLNLPYVAVRLKRFGAEYNSKKLAAIVMRSKNSPRGTPRVPKPSFFCPALERYRFFARDRANPADHAALRQPKIAILMFSNGKIVCTGAKRDNEALYVLTEVMSHLREIGYKGARLSDHRVENWVSSVRLPFRLDIAGMSEAFPSFFTYDPGMFPGVILRYPMGDVDGGDTVKITLLVFKEGRLVITGAKCMNHARHALRLVYPMLREFSVEDGRAVLTEAPVVSASRVNRQVEEIVDKLVAEQKRRRIRAAAEAAAADEEEVVRERRRSRPRPKKVKVAELRLPPTEELISRLRAMDFFAGDARAHVAEIFLEELARLLRGDETEASVPYLVSGAWGAVDCLEQGNMIKRLEIQGMFSSVVNGTAEALRSYASSAVGGGQ